jgi:probable rRNA maturation factor
MAAGLPYGQREGQGDSRPDHNPDQPRTRALRLQDRHPARGVNLNRLRPIIQNLLGATWPEAVFDLAIYLVDAPEMTRLNETFLHHKGSTDVITFDYTARAGQGTRRLPFNAPKSTVEESQDAPPALLHGEIFVCLDEAMRQARRYRTTWQSELVRYVVHGVLHLLGYNDHRREARRRMKAAEDALVRRLAGQFDFRGVSQPRKACRARI